MHWMNENALRVEMGIPLLAHPKHTYSKIGGLTDSESEYSSNSEDELDNLIQYSKEVESNSAKNSKTDQVSMPNLIIYATHRKGGRYAWKSGGSKIDLLRPLALRSTSAHSKKAPR